MKVFHTLLVWTVFFILKNILEFRLFYRPSDEWSHALKMCYVLIVNEISNKVLPVIVIHNEIITCLEKISVQTKN